MSLNEDLAGEFVNRLAAYLRADAQRETASGEDAAILDQQCAFLHKRATEAFKAALKEKRK